MIRISKEKVFSRKLAVRKVYIYFQNHSITLQSFFIKLQTSTTLHISFLRKKHEKAK